MPEPTTTVGLAALGAYLSKDAINKLLGPTFDYLGDELLAFTKMRVENVGKIFSNAEKKLGDKLDRPGQVPPKVLKTIINEGSYSDDEIATEYFGGVLASSRTEVGRDDRGSRIAKIIDNLSAYQIRSHYLIYSTISELFSNRGNSFDLPGSRRKLGLFMPFHGYCDAMAFTQQEFNNGQLLSHIIYGLSADELIDDVSFGSQEFLKKIANGVPGAGLMCGPTPHGAELFLWAFGHGDKELDFLLTDDFSPEIEGISKSVPNTVAIQNISHDKAEPFHENLEELLELI